MSVDLEISGGIAKIRFNRPDRLNALDVGMALAFRDIAQKIAGRSDVRVITLSGAGRAFMAGGDLAYLRAATDRAAAARALIAPMHEGLLLLHGHGAPTIAMVHGAVAGAGMSLALFADFTIAADNTTFGMAYIKVAAPPDCGASWTLVRAVGLRKATEIMLLGEAMDADTALAAGLVNRVVAADALQSETDALAARLAAGPPQAIAATRDLLTRALGFSLQDSLDAELEAFAACAAAADFEEALAAFFERRAPQFTG